MFHKKVSSVSTLEALESRIAPAVVFLAGTDAFRNGMSVLVPDSATEFGVDAAFLLEAGDSLVVDVNHDGVFKAADDLLVAKVSKGRALLFFDNRDGVAGFSSDEITGAMVSNGFIGEINGDVHGSVVAGLKIRGDVGWDSIPSTIAGLTVTGTVFGDIFADGAIKNVTIKSAGNDSFASVQGIWSGTSANGLFSFGGISYEYVSSATAKSASDITNISLARGVKTIVSGAGLNGGDISNVIIGRQVTDLTIYTGDSFVLSGGRGGSIHDVDIHGANDDINFTIQTGWGSMRKAHAGAGGSIDSVLIIAEHARLGTVEITAGNGGDGSIYWEDFGNYANGGNGGDLRGVTLIAGSVGSTTILSGHGGQAGLFHRAAETEMREKVFRHRDIFGNLIEEIMLVDVVIRPQILRGGHGGDGGTIQDIQVHARTTLEMRAGQGGNSELRTAGNAGSIFDVETHGLLGANIYAGIAGMGRFGGDGADISRFTATEVGANAEIRLEAGDSGGGMKKGGHSGNISEVSIFSDESLALISVAAGRGFFAEDYNQDSIARGTDGGDISGVNVAVKGASEIYIVAGLGGNGGYHATEVGNPEFGRVKKMGGAGGDGGNIDGVSIHAQQAVETFFIESGRGGNGRIGKSAGAGGSVSNIELVNYSDAEIRTGKGGVSTAGRSGNGGDLFNLRFSTNQTESALDLSAGDGGEGGDEGGSGGHGGSIAHVNGKEILSGSIFIVAGYGGNGRDYMVEPQFVDVDRPKLVPDGAGGWQIEYVTKTIKVANRIARAGAGGNGGSVSDISWNTLAGGDTHLSIDAGAGGEGSSAYDYFERLADVPNSQGGYFEDDGVFIKIFSSKAAGTGGDIRNVKLNAAENTKVAFGVESGKGGVAYNFATPARGGIISGVRIDSLGVVSRFSLHAGNGGDAYSIHPRTTGGDGGLIRNVHVSANELSGYNAIVGGTAGEGPKRAGAGGYLANISLTSPNAFYFSFIPGLGSPDGVLKNVFPKS